MSERKDPSTLKWIFTEYPEDLSPELKSDLEKGGFQWISEPPLNKTHLVWKDNSLALVLASGKTLTIDFSANKYQRQFKPSTDLLCRACGWHLGLRTVWDLTAGLGVDSIVLARAGFEVKTFERNPYLIIMLRQAQREQAASFTYLNKIEFVCSDSEFIWNEQEIKLKEKENKQPEVVYYDPMYPPTKKSALPSKEIQILRELNGTNDENKGIVEKALQEGIHRVVVKRPHRAPPLKNHPTSQILGKLLRFDIYMNNF